MYLDISKQGAASVRRSATKSPLHLLATLIDKNPGMDRHDIFDIWVLTMCKADGMPHLVNKINDDGYLWAALKHTFTNLLQSLNTNAKRQNQTRLKTEASARQRKSVEAIKNQVKHLLLMNLVLPNGKRLGDATFADCAKAGGWFAAVAIKGRPAQIVGKVLTEQDLRNVKIQV